MKNDGTVQKSPSSRKGCFKGCLLAGAIVLTFFTALTVFLNWGIFRSLSYSLTGVEFPTEIVYRTDTSNRGRELGFWVEVYRLPENLQDLLNEKKIDLNDYPMFSGLKWDGYTRVMWTGEFPRNDAEKTIYDSIKKDIDPTHVPTLESVSDDQSAKDLAGCLLNDRNTLWGGWYKSHKGPDGVMVSDYFIYILNIEKRTLIMFGRDT